MKINFPKYATEKFLKSLNAKQRQIIREYAKTTNSRTKYYDGKTRTIAEVANDYANDGGGLNVTQSGRVSIHGFSHDKFNIYSGMMVTCFYALFYREEKNNKKEEI